MILAAGNGSFTPKLADTIRRELPNCRFVRYTPLPDATEHPIRMGMTPTQVERAVGQKMYDQRTDWKGNPGPTVAMLGSLHQTYPNPDGTMTWTYATDDIGVGTIVIDFDANQRVATVSLSHGIPAHLINHLNKMG